MTAKVTEGLPSDSFSSLLWRPGEAPIIAGTSWDGSLSVWSLGDGGSARTTNRRVKTPLLSFAWSPSGNRLFAGGCSGKLFAWNLKDDLIEVAKHAATISCVNTVKSSDDVIYTGSWDKTVRLWDARQKRQASSFATPDRVYSMDISPSSGDPLVATASRHIVYFDRRRPDTPKVKLLSPLPFQSRCIRFADNDTSFVLASISGQCALGDFRAKSSTTFLGSCEDSLAVNSISRHPSGLIALGDSGGAISIWSVREGRATAKLPPKRQESSPVTAIAFNSASLLLGTCRGFDGIHNRSAKPSLIIQNLRR